MSGPAPDGAGTVASRPRAGRSPEARSGRHDVIADARRRIRQMLMRLVPEGPVALLDCPGHPNVGDSAIWLGEREALRSAGLGAPEYTCTIASYDPGELRRRLPRGTVLLHGGGNFGDLYSAYQEFRERVIRQFPRHRIVVLPQSLRFRREENRERARRVCEAHPDLHLLVRTRRSLERARRTFDLPVYLCPDMAFALGPLPEMEASGSPRLLLLRRDAESRGAAAEGDVPRERESLADWGSGYREPGTRAAFIHWLVWRWRGNHGRQLEALADYTANFLTRRAWCRVMAGLRMLSGRDVVITDRLHGHILAFLAGVPHVALDNSYGKVHAYVRTWTEASDLVQTAATLRQARIAAREATNSRVGAAPGDAGASKSRAARGSERPAPDSTASQHMWRRP